MAFDDDRRRRKFFSVDAGNLDGRGDNKDSWNNLRTASCHSFWRLRGDSTLWIEAGSRERVWGRKEDGNGGREKGGCLKMEDWQKTEGLAKDFCGGSGWGIWQQV
jgi:hypothetical protein